MDIAAKEQTEIGFWEKTSLDDGLKPLLSQSLGAWPTKLHRMAESRIFLEKLERFAPLFEKARDVLELGGGQCWASCLVKVNHPQTRVTGTDIAPSAIAGTVEWERIFQVKLDGSRACRSYETGFPDASFDLVFVFSAAHHFGRYRQTVKELARILRPGGHALFLHEPTCPQPWYKMAHARINRHSYGVPEDVLLPHKFRRFAGEFGMTMELVYAPSLTFRGPLQTMYYYVLNKLPFLQRIMPCSADLVFTKT